MIIPFYHLKKDQFYFIKKYTGIVNTIDKIKEYNTNFNLVIFLTVSFSTNINITNDMINVKKVCNNKLFPTIFK